MKFQIKGFASLLLAFTFLILGFSGIVLYLTPRGRVANWTGWTMLGLDKQGWQAIHINVALLFLIAAALHLYLNWSVFWCYIKQKRSLALNLKIEMVAALLLAVGITAGAIHGIPPFSTIMDWNTQVKDYWERQAAEAPTPHAEELTLNQFADNLGLSADDLMKALQQEQVVVADSSATIAQIAQANSITPADVYAAIKKRFPERDKGGRREGKGRGMGQGKGQGRGVERSGEE
jgi:hypothetical protein